MSQDYYGETKHCGNIHLYNLLQHDRVLHVYVQVRVCMLGK